jgi:outer membrane protein TolC
LAEQAVANNPEVAAMQGRVDELDALSAVAGVWQNPSLGVSLSNLPVDSWALDGHAMTGVQLQLKQTFNAPGTLRHRRATADAHVAMAEVNREVVRQDLTLAVRKGWWSLAQARLLRALTEQHLAWTIETEKAANRAYEVGQSSQATVLRWKILHQQLNDQLNDFNRQEAEWLAGLRSALHDHDLAIDAPDAVEAVPVPDSTGWAAVLADSSPALDAARLAQATRSAEATLARIEGRPDPSVMVGVRVRDNRLPDGGTELVTLGAELPLPAGGTRAARGRSTSKSHAASAAGLSADAQLANLQAELDVAQARWAAAATRSKAWTEEAIPAARQALQLTDTEYRVGKADLTTLYQAEVLLLQLERDAIMAAVQTHLQQAHVARLLGDAGGNP